MAIVLAVVCGRRGRCLGYCPSFSGPYGWTDLRYPNHSACTLTHFLLFAETQKPNLHSNYEIGSAENQRAPSSDLCGLHRAGAQLCIDVLAASAFV